MIARWAFSRPRLHRRHTDTPKAERTPNPRRSGGPHFSPARLRRAGLTVATNISCISPTKGGCALVIRGEVSKLNQITDEKSGEVKGLVEISWWGGSKYFVVPLSHDLMRAQVGSPIELHQPYTHGKSGFRADGPPVIAGTTTNGSAAKSGAA